MCVRWMTQDIPFGVPSLPAGEQTGDLRGKEAFLMEGSLS